MRTIVVLVAALALAAPAAAKEMMHVTVCGADGCTSTPDPPNLRALVSLGPGGEAPEAAPFYGVSLRAEGSAGVVRTVLYVPSAGALRVEDAVPFWTRVPVELQPLLQQVTARADPYPASSAPWSAQAPADRPTWPLLVAPLGALALVAAALRRRRPAAVGIAAVVVLSLAGVASAKNWGIARLCGPESCARSAGVLMSLPAGEARRIPPLAPYYDRCRGCGGFYVPSRRAYAGRAGSTFTRVTDEAAAVFERLAAKVTPFPTPRITAAFVGERRVRGDANTYARLFELETDGRAVNAGSDWVPIDLRSARDTPWTNGATYLAYSPSENLLQRGPELLRVPAAIARRLDRAQALDTGP
jgi:hypothetical protein